MITLALFIRRGVFSKIMGMYVNPFKARIAADSGFFEGQSCLISKLNKLK